MRILLVVDMQPDFQAVHRDGLIGRVLALIDEYKQQKLPIILVEITNRKHPEMYRPTLAEIQAAVTDYPLVGLVQKECDDGSKEIVNEYAHWLADADVELCGVNACACVRDTMEGLRYKGYAATMRKEACGCFPAAHHGPMFDHDECVLNATPADATMQHS